MKLLFAVLFSLFCCGTSLAQTAESGLHGLALSQQLPVQAQSSQRAQRSFPEGCTEGDVIYEGPDGPTCDPHLFYDSNGASRNLTSPDIGGFHYVYKRNDGTLYPCTTANPMDCIQNYFKSNNGFAYSPPTYAPIIVEPTPSGETVAPYPSTPCLYVDGNLKNPKSYGGTAADVMQGGCVPPWMNGSLLDDYRSGTNFQTAINPKNLYPNMAYAFYTYYTIPYGASVGYPNRFAEVHGLASLAGGWNFNSVYKSNDAAFLIDSLFASAGQHSAGSIGVNCTGVGDCLGMPLKMVFSTGCNVPGDECTHHGDDSIEEDSHVFHGAIASCAPKCGPGATSLQITLPNDPNVNQGVGRYALDIQVNTVKIKGWSVKGAYPSTTVTFDVSSSTNPVIAGQLVNLTGFTVGASFNGQTVAVLLSGLTPTSFEASLAAFPLPGASADTGTGTVGERGQLFGQIQYGTPGGTNSVPPTFTAIGRPFPPSTSVDTLASVSIAPIFDSTLKYSPGDLVTASGTLYVNITGCTGCKTPPSHDWAAGLNPPQWDKSIAYNQNALVFYQGSMWTSQVTQKPGNIPKPGADWTEGASYTYTTGKIGSVFGKGLACIGDTLSYEQVEITRVEESIPPDITSRLTLIALHPHYLSTAGGAMITQGGPCGSFITLNADTSKPPQSASPPGGFACAAGTVKAGAADCIRQAYPIIGTPSGDSRDVYIWNALDGDWETSIEGNGVSSAQSYQKSAWAYGTRAASASNTDGGSTYTVSCVGCDLLITAPGQQLGLGNITGYPVTLACSSNLIPEYNGTFTVTSVVDRNTFTYSTTALGTTSSCSPNSMTVTLCNCGFTTFQGAEVTSVLDPAPGSLGMDGYLALGPNHVDWTASDEVEEAHYHQPLINDVYQFEGTVQPQLPSVASGRGVQFTGTFTGRASGFSVKNSANNAIYYGFGGTSNIPTAGFATSGLWRQALSLSPAPTEAVIQVGEPPYPNPCTIEKQSYYSLFALTNPTAATDQEGYNCYLRQWQWYIKSQQIFLGPSAGLPGATIYPSFPYDGGTPDAYAGLKIGASISNSYAPSGTSVGRIFAALSSGANGNSDLSGNITLTEATASKTIYLNGVYESAPTCNAWLYSNNSWIPNGPTEPASDKVAITDWAPSTPLSGQVTLMASNNLAGGMYITLSEFAQAALNGRFRIVAATSTTLVIESNATTDPGPGVGTSSYYFSWQAATPAPANSMIGYQCIGND